MAPGLGPGIIGVQISATPLYMKLYAENCTVIFHLEDANIKTIEILKENEEPYRINIRTYGKTSNVISTSKVKDV